MNTLDNIEELESSIPVVLKEPVKHTLTASAEAMMSKTEPFIGKSRIRAAEHRLTSAAQRSLRETKRDVEEMHRILKAKKKAQMAATADAARAQSRAASRGHTAGGASEHNAISTPQSPGSRGASRGQNKDTGRPITPDLTVDNEGVPLDAGQELRQAVVLLQRLIRGRAVQNVMYEGRMRRAELIHELRSADETLEAQGHESAVDVANEVKSKREQDAKLRTVDNIIGGTASSLMVLLNQEQDRVDLFSDLEAIAEVAEKDRLKREVAEGGRRQKEGKRYPEETGPAPAEP